MGCPVNPQEVKTDELQRKEYLGIIQAEMNRHERSHQYQIGPSEAGGCRTKVAWKLAYGGAGTQDAGWSAQRGTVIHAWLDQAVFGSERAPLMPDGSQRFFSDMKLQPTSPHVNGGTLDLYDRMRETVVDFKIPGDWTMKNVRSGQLSEGYRVQAQIYAYGLEQMGFPVSRCALLFMPSCADDLHSSGKGSIFRYWDYDRQVAIDAFADIARIRNMLDATTPQRVMEVLPKKDDFCSSCPASIMSGDRRAVCPGVAAKRAKSSSSNANPFG